MSSIISLAINRVLNVKHVFWSTICNTSVQENGFENVYYTKLHKTFESNPKLQQRFDSSCTNELNFPALVNPAT